MATTKVGILQGGTGASTAANARTNLGLAIGSDVQAYNALLAAIAGLTPTDGNIIVGNGSTFVAESGATARTSLGLGSAAVAALIDDDTFASATSSNIPSAESVKAYVDANSYTFTNKLDATVAPDADNDTTEGYDVGSFWLDVSNGETYRCLDNTEGAAVWVKTSLTIDELGSLATLSSINNSNWSGTDLAVANGGTGASDAATARSNLSAAESGANTDITSLLLSQTGLVVKGGDSNALTIKPNETLTAARVLNVVVNDADRTLSLSGNLTVSGSTTISTYANTFLNTADEAAFKAAVNLEIGTDVQAFDAELSALAGLTSAANKVPMFSGSGTATLLDFKDEDDMSSDSATAVASQQSIKAYVDSSVPTFVKNEVPTGSINGSNTTFTLANTPTAGSVELFANGTLLLPGAGNDYTISGDTITMLYALDTGSVLLAHYHH